MRYITSSQICNICTETETCEAHTRLFKMRNDPNFQICTSCSIYRDITEYNNNKYKKCIKCRNKAKSKTICICGSIISKSYKSKHIRSPVHLLNLVKINKLVQIYFIKDVSNIIGNYSGVF